MSATPRTRFGRVCAAVLTAVLGGVLVPVLGPTAPAAAAATCTAVTEARPNLVTPGCDDVKPPETTVTAVSPAPNAQGYIRASTVRIDFAGQHTDADTDVIVHECQFYSGSAAPGGWSSCTSPFTRDNLEQSTTTAYTFRVRAVDQADHAIDLTAGIPQQDTDEPDFDQSPATVTLKVDTIAPSTFITRGPVDDIRPDWPVTTTASPEVALNSNEASGFQCTLNRAAVGCAEGAVTLRNLDGGAKTFVARAVDAAGNPDPTPASVKFFVPENIKNSKNSGWSRVKGSGSFGGDYLESSTVGSTLRIKGQRNVREVRLLAPAGPRLGKLQVRVGNSQWYTVDLHSKSSRRQKVYLVRDQYTPRQRGTIQIRVAQVPSGGSVAVDALVARS